VKKLFPGWYPVVTVFDACCSHTLFCLYTKEFAEYVGKADNYFVFFTRKLLKNLPYSINEIYGIRTAGKYHFPEQVYHELYPIYGEKKGADEHKVR
jgi:hypothetical protein